MIDMPDVVRDDASAPFYDGAARGELMIKQCTACGHFVRPAALVCTVCHAPDLAWYAASGAATLVSWVVVHGTDDEVVAGLVELDEGPWFDARVLDAESASLVVGQLLRVSFVDAGEEKIPVFVPRAS